MVKGGRFAAVEAMWRQASGGLLSTSAALWVKGEGFFLFSYCEKTEKFFFCPDFLSISVRNAMMSRWKMLIINFYCLFRQAENAVIGIIFCNFAAKL